MKDWGSFSDIYVCILLYYADINLTMILPPVNVLFWTGQDMNLTCFDN